MQSAPLADLLEWVAAADTCQQPELRLRCIGEVARRLASRNSGLAGAFADAAIVAEQCDKSALAQLLGLVLAAGGQNIAGSLAAPSAAVEALQRAANPGSFEWAFEHYSQKPSGVGQSVEFPWFNVAGREWRFRVDPGAASEEAAGHLSGERAFDMATPVACACSCPLSPPTSAPALQCSLPHLQAWWHTRQLLYHPAGPGSAR